MGLSMSRRQVFYSSCEKEIPSFFQRIVIEIRLNNKSESFGNNLMKLIIEG